MTIRDNRGHDTDLEKINKIHKRQLARFLDHLKDTGQLTPSLEADIKRSFGFIFQDVQTAIQEPDKEKKA